jgi:hypothetical protein
MNGKPAIQLWLPWTIEGKPSEDETTAERPSEDEGLMERVVEYDNLFRALKQVQSNGGSPGIDGMTVAELAPSLKEHWPRLKQALMEGTYQPPPVKRVEVPKPQGGLRKLGVPTVVDRFIQQAGMQVLQAQWDPTFSNSSFGFRPGRNAPQAVKRAQSYLMALSRMRTRSRMASSSTSGTWTDVRSPKRISRASCTASRRSVLMRLPGFFRMSEGATTQQTRCFLVR